jgi:DNA-binding transcriptional ArsR family regulator
VRVRLIDRLDHSGERSVGVLADVLDERLHNVSQHIAILRSADVVTRRHQGREVANGDRWRVAAGLFGRGAEVAERGVGDAVGVKVDRESVVGFDAFDEVFGRERTWAGELPSYALGAQPSRSRSADRQTRCRSVSGCAHHPLDSCPREVRKVVFLSADAQDGYGRREDVASVVEANAACQATPERGAKQLVEHPGAGATGTGDRVEKHLSRLGRVDGAGLYVHSRKGGAEGGAEAPAARREALV